MAVLMIALILSLRIGSYNAMNTLVMLVLRTVLMLALYIRNSG